MSDYSDSSETSNTEEDEFLGPAPRQDIDIVVIPGVEGEKSCPPDLENSEPLEDLLVDRIDGIWELINFEYDVKATFGADKTPGFDEAAVNLLETIWRSDNERNNETGAGESRDTSFVPLVMIAYGLGGRIVQRALCLARRSLKYRSIELRTELLIFVGTPQYSSKDDEFMGDLLWGDVRQEFLSFASRYRILSVYQDLEIMSSEDRFFLNLPTEKHLTRKTRPIDLGQFSPEDEYLKVLTREIESLRKPKNFDGYYDYYLAVLRSLNKKKFLKIYQDEPMLQTRFFGWIEEENPKAVSWLLEPASRILLVSGDEGSGVRSASQSLMEQAEERYKKSAISTVSASFTFDSFDDRFNTLEAMFTSLILQLLLADPTLFSFLADVEAGSVADMLSDDINEPAVSRLWCLMKTLLSYRGRRAIICVINALQDCKSDYTTFLENLMNFSSVSEANFKIVLTSVHDGTRLKVPLSITLDQEAAMKWQRDKAMRLVSGLIRTKPSLEEFEGYIASTIVRTMGTNVWQTNLYLKYLEMSMTHTAPKSVRDTMISLGEEPIQSIISHSLHRLTDHDQGRSLRMLAWVIYCFRPLEVPELATAMALDFVDPASSAQKPVSLDCDPIDDWYSRNISADIQLALGDIVEICGTEVSIANRQHLRQAVIEEVRRRANRPDSSSKTEGEKSEATELFKNINHLTIAQMCLGYLSVERMERVLEFLDEQHDSTILPRSGPYQDNFCMYAAQYWPAHYLSIQGPTTEVVTTIIIERFKSPTWLAAWRKLSDHLGCLEHRIPEIPDFQAPLSFYCASLGLRAALEVALEKEVQMLDDETKDIILMTATRSGNLETVKYLLSKFDYQQESISKAIAEPPISGNQAVISELLKRFQWEQGSSAITSLLERAAYMNGPPLLIQTAADQLKQHHSGLTVHLQPALHAAIKVGNKAAAKIILDLKSLGTKASKTATDEESQTQNSPSNLLHLAVANGNVNLLSMLASENLSIDMRDKKNRTAPHLAVMLSYQSMVRHLILMKIDVTAKDILGRTALHYAALMGHLEIVKELLLQEVIEIDEMDLAGNTPLLLATKMRQREVVEELLEEKASSRKRNKLKETALHIAVRNADESIVQLIAAAEDVNLEAKTKDSCTPLLLAAENGHLDIFKHLLSRGAEKNVVDADGLTPLHLAAKNGHVALVKMLLQYNADIESENFWKRTPVMIACQAGNVETALQAAIEGNHRSIVELIFKTGPDIRSEDCHGNSPLCHAVRFKSDEMVIFMIERGADVNHINMEGCSALHLAIASRFDECVKLLVGAKANLNISSHWIVPPLYYAATRGTLTSFSILLDATADIEFRSRIDNTTCMYAVCVGGENISFSGSEDTVERIKLLEKKGANVKALGGDWGSPLHAAIAMRHEYYDYQSLDVVDYLLSRGASVTDEDEQGRSAVHIAASTKGSLDSFIKILGRDPNGLTRQDKQGRTVWHHAATAGNLHVLGYILRLIRSHDCENEESSQIPKDLRIKDAISQGDKHGWTPLMWSCKQENREIGFFLVHYGADANHISQMDWKADDVATYHGQKTVTWRMAQAKRRADRKAKAKAKETLMESQRHNPGVEADDDDDDDSELSPYSSSDDDAYDVKVLVDGKPVRKATWRRVICGGCATVIYGPYWMCEDRRLYFCFKCSWTRQETHPGLTFELNDERCTQGEMPPAPGTDSAQVVCTVPLLATDDLNDSVRDLMFSS
ncbi:ankyrin repeats (3 copies) domain-containing protein [Trichoderma breve]|uniref:Ankyrin repeats (3 copies) domain-containing protein n=1 Tax=Trichoderma breve TaxID=2034170 RepID=A0A9W9B6P1_9HYPO|nr:ankyrin repeats (3 copies) domain-containing protein [Trichoderma breve]KAJ4856949.1 ankyrin repeats (3 copies) domain-containing protein [Trichoderma breve]